MPFLSQEPQANQTALLPTERTVSGIPKATDAANWEYPSPQQFHNALVRKGKEAPVEHVESMVDIHNWLNEACWQEITQWEQKYYPECKPTLVKFTGRPDDVSPMARLYATFYGLHFNDLGKHVRYVIDYYGGPTNEMGNPSFHVNVRPAIDSPSDLLTRLRAGASSLWDRAFKSE